MDQAEAVKGGPANLSLCTENEPDYNGSDANRPDDDANAQKMPNSKMMLANMILGKLIESTGNGSIKTQQLNDSLYVLEVLIIRFQSHKLLQNRQELIFCSSHIGTELNKITVKRTST